MKEHAQQDTNQAHQATEDHPILPHTMTKTHLEKKSKKFNLTQLSAKSTLKER